MISKKEFYKIVEQHYRECYIHLCKTAQHNGIRFKDAEDVVQEAYTRALQYWKSFDGVNFDGWFYIILQNCINNQHRSNRSNGMTRDDEYTVPAEADAHTKLHFKEIMSYLDGIKEPTKRYVARCFLVLGYRYKELDEVTDMDKAAVRKMVQRIREELKTIYETSAI